MAERHVQSTFIRWLKQNFPDVMIYNTPPQKYVAGIPDMICVCGGRSIWIEIKAWTKKPRPSQLSWLRLHAKHGGISFWGMDVMTLADLWLDAFEAGMLATTERVMKNHSLGFRNEAAHIRKQNIVTGQIWRTKAWR